MKKHSLPLKLTLLLLNIGLLSGEKPLTCVWKIGALSRWVDPKPEKVVYYPIIEIEITPNKQNVILRYTSTNCFYSNATLYFYNSDAGKWMQFSLERYTFVISSNYVKGKL